MSLPQPYYQDELVTLYHGDARDLLPQLGLEVVRDKVVVITDPPWPGVSEEIDIVGRADALEVWQGVASLVPSIADRLVVQLGGLVDPRGMLAAVPAELQFRCSIWCRFMPPMRRGPHLVGADVAYAFGAIRVPNRDDGTRGYILPAELAGSPPASRWLGGHPCPRNLGHVEGLVRWYAAKAELVIDPFLGSGTTLEACKRRGVRAIGIDVDERWCREAARRLAMVPVFGRLDLREVV